MSKNVCLLIGSGRFKPIVVKAFPFTEAAEAHRLWTRISVTKNSALG